MATIFCPSCGSKANYLHAVPNFCGKCGQPYIPTFSSKEKIKSAISSTRTSSDPDDQFDDEEDENWDGDEMRSSTRGDFFSDSMRVPRLSKLNVEIDSSTDVRVFKMSDILGVENKSFNPPRTKNLNDLIDDV